MNKRLPSFGRLLVSILMRLLQRPGQHEGADTKDQIDRGDEIGESLLSWYRRSSAPR